jgi:hypothetical protein
VKFTLHRSIIFWAGILLILFTCWAWIDSRSHQSRICGKQLSAASANHGIFIHRQAGATFDFAVNREPMPSPNEPYRAPFLVHSRATDPEMPEDTPPLKEWCQIMVDNFPLGTWALYLPYWLILIPLILTWLALLSLRARRLKRAPSL